MDSIAIHLHNRNDISAIITEITCPIIKSYLVKHISINYENNHNIIHSNSESFMKNISWDTCNASWSGSIHVIGRMQIWYYQSYISFFVWFIGKNGILSNYVGDIIVYFIAFLIYESISGVPKSLYN